MERLTSTLLRLMERIGHDDEGGSIINLPMTREDLADYAGLTIETVSRCFSRLRKQGVILLKDKGSVLVPHPEALERLAGD
jgi:CRP/FNR family transcriptional regulator